MTMLADLELPVIDDKHLFRDCAECPADLCCCNKVRRDGTVDAPLLVPTDLARLDARFGHDMESFLDRRISEEGKEHVFLRTNTLGGCVFSSGGNCILDDIRPIDCRLFPLDIWEIDGVLHWILYEKLCPAQFDIEQLLAYGKSLLHELSEAVTTYATVCLGAMDKEPVRVLERVVIPKAKRGEGTLDSV